MDGCDWVEDAVDMYKKGLAAGDFEKLKDLAQESNGDLAVTSELWAHGPSRLGRTVKHPCAI